MIDLTGRDKINNKQNSYSVILSQLVCISSLTTNYIDSKVIVSNETSIKIEGLYEITDTYAVAGEEIVYINTYEASGLDTILYVTRAMKNTKLSTLEAGSHIRTVDLFEATQDFQYKESIGNISNVFDYSLNEGSVILDSDYKYWNKSNPSSYYYEWDSKKNYVYYFLGIEDELVLKHTTLLKEVRANSVKNSVKVSFRDKMYKYWDLDVNNKEVLSNKTPSEFLSTLLGVSQSEIKYSNNQIEDDFNIIRSVNLSDYEKISDVILAYVKSGVRIAFDRLEKIVLFNDKIIDNIITQREIDATLFEKLDNNSNERLIFNKITGNYTEYGRLDNGIKTDEYVRFSYSLLLSSFTLIDSTNKIFNTLSVTNSDLANRTALSNYVCLKKGDTGEEIYGQVVKIEGNDVDIVFQTSSKDSRLNFLGRIDYYISQGYDLPKIDWTLYYNRNEKVVIWGDVRKFEEERSTFMKRPLLPIVKSAGLTVFENKRTVEAEFGSPTGLQDGIQYAGYFEEIEDIYGTFDENDLFYNREIEQFDGINVNVGAISNRITIANGNSDDSIITYDTFDNSNLEVSIYKSNNSTANAVIDIVNKKEIDFSQLYEATPTGKLADDVLEVPDSTISNYNVGDVLVVKKPASFPDLNAVAEYYNTLSNIKWTITEIKTEGGITYLFLDSDFPDNYSFYRYNSTDIIYLQSLYIRGVPIVKVENTIDYILEQTSIDRYGEKSLQLPSDFLDQIDFRQFIDYYKSFVATNNSNTKTIKTLPIWGNIDLEMFDIITIDDPYITEEDGSVKYVILEIDNKDISKGNCRTIKVMNINESNSIEVDDLNIYEKIKFQPPNTPNSYSPTGNEGTERAEVNTTESEIIKATDNTLGDVGLVSIVKSRFYGRITDLIQNTITFSSIFYGSEEANYKDKFFPQDSLLESEEFVIKIFDELIYCQSIPSVGNYQARILKRSFLTQDKYKGSFENVDVIFYEIVNKSTVEEGYISKKAYFGDQFSYMKFDRIDGLDVKTVGNVNIENPNNRFFMDKDGSNSQLLLNVAEVNWDKVNTYFQLNETTDSNYFKFGTNGLEMAGKMSLNTSSSYVDFSSGYRMDSYDSTSFSGVRFVKTGTLQANESKSYFFITNLKSSDDSLFTFGNTYRDGSNNEFIRKLGIINTNKSIYLFNEYDAPDTTGESTNNNPIVIEGLTIGENVPDNPSNFTLRRNGANLEGYYNGTWQIIKTFV